MSKTKILIPLALLVLTGCWRSAQPLMPTSVMDDVNLATIYFTGKDDSAFEGTPYRLSRSGRSYEARAMETNEVDEDYDGGPSLLGPPPEAHLFSFDMLQKDIYLVQVLTLPDRSVKSYQIMKIGPGKTIKAYEPKCEMPELALPGVSKNNDGECMFSNYATLLGAAQKRAVEIAAGRAEAYYLQRYVAPN